MDTTAGRGNQTFNGLWPPLTNQLGPDGLMNAKGAGRPRFLNDDQMQELARIVEAGPDLKADGVVRWRRIDLVRKIKALFGIRPV